MEQRPELVLTPRRGRADRWVQAETDAGEQSSAGHACVHPDLGSPAVCHFTPSQVQRSHKCEPPCVVYRGPNFISGLLFSRHSG